MKHFSLFALVLAALLLAGSPLHAAKVILKITKWSSDGILQQYSNNPGTYPVTQEKLSCIAFGGSPDDCVRSNGTRIFDTTVGALTVGTGENSDGTFSGDEVVREMRKYENVGLTVDNVLIYREDWLYRDTGGGPFDEDPRILSDQDLTNVRSAIANSNLKSKDSVKLIQLLRGRGSWYEIRNNPATLAHLLKFDGLGMEFHVGDYSKAEGEERLDIMALITKWTLDNNKIGYVFTGGTPATYELPARTRATYNALWNRMAALGVEKDSSHLIYFRQGARPGAHAPESENTLSAQIAELIGHVWTASNPDPEPEPGPTSGLVAHWPLDGAPGETTATDASGYGPDGTLHSGAAFANDAVRGNHVVFDGVNDRIDTGFTYALSSTDKFTWAWWAKSTLPSTDTTQQGSIMVGNRYGGTGTEAYEFIKFTPDGAQFANTNISPNPPIGKYGYTVATGEWKHYAMVKDGSSYKFYVNGSFQASTETAFTYNETSPIPFFIGGDGAGGGNEHFNGGIDDVVLYRSALTPQDVSNVMNGIYDLTVTLVALEDAVPLTAETSWSDGAPAHANANYVIPITGHLKSEDGTSTFPGTSLTAEAGGKFQVRSKQGSGEVTTVDQLILEGGSSFTTGNFAELAAGTGNDETNVLDGHITNSGFSRFTTYGKVGGSNINRSLKVQSRIVGSGRIQAFENSADGISSVIIEYPDNSFHGTWEIAPGSTLVFDDAGAVGTANIEVLAGGVLEIKGNWSTGAGLAVADAPDTNIKLGIYGWKIPDLILGSASVADGVYTAADLNALTTNPVFTGFGTITVGAGLPGGPIAHWKLDESPGTPFAIDSSGGGNAGTLLPGATFIVDPTRGPVASFDGNLGRITTEFTYTLSSSDDFTWTWWAKRTATGSNGAVMVGNRYPENRPDGERYEFIKFTPIEAQFANVEEAGSVTKYTYTAIPLNEWKHYAMVKSGTQYRWYENGELIKTENFSYSEDTPIPFNIGGDDDGSGTKTGEHFTGLIDDVVLYGRALGPIEVEFVQEGIYSDLPTSELEAFRKRNFGTTKNTIPAADDYDANFDGESNLLEFATGQDPYANTFAEVSVTFNEANLEFHYTRSNAAMADGMTFQVEWSDTLLEGSWSMSEVVDVLDTENPGDSETVNHVATVPLGVSGRRFVQLKVTP
jgi:hypothetical protein